MPVTHHSLTAAQDPAGPNNENAAASRAYHLISQLRQPFPLQSPLPGEPLGAPDWQEAEREPRSRLAG